MIDDVGVCVRLARRAAYFKEVYVVWAGCDERLVAEAGFEVAGDGRVVQVGDTALLFRGDGARALRILCDQWVLESAYYAAVLSGSVGENLERLLRHLNWGVCRSPMVGAKGSVEDYADSHSVGKSAESKYLTHGIHPYHGKFFARMARALINFMGLGGEDKLLDPFCGSGTTLLEASLLGIRSLGVDVNPLACMISRAKVGALQLDVDEIRRAYSSLLPVVRAERGQTALVDVKLPPEPWSPVEVAAVCLSAALEGRGRVRRPRDLEKAYESEFNRLIRQLEAFSILRRKLGVKLAPVEVIQADIMELDMEGEFDALLTSPPYIMTVDYVNEHRPSIVKLKLADSSQLESIEAKTIGLPSRVSAVELPESLLSYVKEAPSDVRRVVAAYASDVYRAFKRIRKTLKPGAKIAVAVGKNHRFSGKLVPTTAIVKKALEEAGYRITEVLEIKCPGLSAFKRGDWIECIILGERI